MLKSLFNIVAGLRPATLLQRTPEQVFSCEFLTRPNFVEHLQTTAFRNTITWGFNLIYKNLRKIHIVSNGSNIVSQSLTVFYFMAWNRNILFQTWNISLLWIFIFSYTTYLVEKLLFYAPHNIKVSPPSTNEKTNIHNSEIFNVRFAIMQKTAEKTCQNVRWK